MITKFKMFEYLELADKLYFKSGEISESDKYKILSITKNDNYTKVICDLFLFLQKNRYLLKNNIMEVLRDLYEQIKNYNKNTFPIKGFDITKKNDNLYFELDVRGKIIDTMRKLPKVAIRNLKNEIRQERSYGELSNYLHLLEYFSGLYSMLGNRDDELKEKILKKMFKSNMTIDKLVDFVDEKENLLGGKEFTKEMIQEIISDNDYDLRTIYDKEKIMVVEVSSLDGIKLIGCNSLWCFTYGHSYNAWHNYSTNGIVYVIIDFNCTSDDSQFMYVLIKPLEKKYTEDNEDESPLFNMANEQETAPIWYLKRVFGKYNFRKLFTFGLDKYA